MRARRLGDEGAAGPDPLIHFGPSLGGSMTSGELAERFDCTWPTTSRHLASEAGRAHFGGRTRAHRHKLTFGGGFFPEVRALYSRSVSGRRYPQTPVIQLAIAKLESWQVQDHCNGFSQLAECHQSDVAASDEDPLW